MVIVSRLREVLVRFVLPVLGLTVGLVLVSYAFGWLGDRSMPSGVRAALLVASALCVAFALVIACLANRRSQRAKWIASRSGNEIHMPDENSTSSER